MSALKYCALSLFVLSAGSAHAQDRASSVTVFPPIMREMARETAVVRSMADLATTPQPVPAARRPAQPDLVAQRYVEPVAAARTGSLD